MSLAFYASPIDFNKNEESKTMDIKKNKLDLNLLKQLTQTKESNESQIEKVHLNAHQDLKEENEAILSDFYNKEQDADLKSEVAQNSFTQDSYQGENIKTDYLIAGLNAGSKIEKATELGIKIFNEADFIKMINNND